MYCCGSTNLGVNKMSENIKQVLKLNAIETAKHHKLHCCGESCNVSLSMLSSLLVEAGITLTKEERSNFI
jgi:hypothetical protein